MKKIGGYPHNGYPTDMGTGTGRIFIQRVGYGGTTTRTLPAPLTSLSTPKQQSKIVHTFITDIQFMQYPTNIKTSQKIIQDSKTLTSPYLEKFS